VGQGRPRLANLRERQTARVSGGVIAGADPSASASPRNIGYNPTGLAGAPAYFAMDAIKTKRLTNPGPLVSI
jgi:hypothetical protein